MEKLLKWGKSIFAIIPGFAIIALNLGVPPGMSKLLLGGIIEACGIFILVIFRLQETHFKRKSQVKLRRRAVGCFIAFLIFLTSYFILFDLQVIYSSRYDTEMLIPIKLNSELQYMIGNASSVSKAIDAYGPEAFRSAINNSKGSIAFTKSVFFLNYILIFGMLTLSFAWGAAKTKEQ
jgi:hypothetical protein